jgi:hypothetical protein
MPIVRILLVFLALASPALAQDGARDAAAAREAAQAFRVYVEGVMKEDGRPDLTRPEVAALLGRVFDLDALNALPPAQANDIIWLLDWMDAANTTNKLLIRYSAIEGPQPDLVAIQRNMTKYEDQYAAAVNFLIRGFAREAVTSKLFMAGLAPAQRPRAGGGTGAHAQRRRRINLGRYLFGDPKRRQSRQRPPGGGRHPRHARGLGELFSTAGSRPHGRTARRP